MKISAVERGAEYLLERAMAIGEDAGRWANAMIEERGIEGVRVLQGLLYLAGKHPQDVINRASKVALESRCFKLKPLRKLCDCFRESQQETLFAEEHPIIRPLSEYQRLISKVSFRVEHGEEVKR